MKFLICFFALMVTGCIVTENTKKTIARLNDRAHYMLENEKANVATGIVYFRENAEDAHLAERDVGSPAHRINIHDQEEVDTAQDTHNTALNKREKVLGILGTIFVVVIGLATGKIRTLGSVATTLVSAIHKSTGPTSEEIKAKIETIAKENGKFSVVKNTVSNIKAKLNL